MDDRPLINRRSFLTDLMCVGGGLLASLAWMLMPGRDDRPRETQRMPPPRESDTMVCAGVLTSGFPPPFEAPEFLKEPRSAVVAGLGVAIMAWRHAQIRRQLKVTVPGDGDPVATTDDVEPGFFVPPKQQCTSQE